ncbi:MAG: glycosyltransferase family 4 protein [Methylotetracoccus sp.]
MSTAVGRPSGEGIIEFICPPWGGVASGGNRFNRCIVERARCRGFPLEVIHIGPGREGSTSDYTGRFVYSTVDQTPALRIWDSLLMPRLADSTLGHEDPPAAVLMHFLPSLDPALDRRSRQSARAIEDAALMRVRGIIATGRGFAETLRARYPRIPVAVCEPGVDLQDAHRPRRRRESLDTRPVRLLTVANLLPAKGYQELLDALRQCGDLRWIWHIVGSDRPEPRFAGRFLAESADLARSGLMIWHGSLRIDQIAQLMDEVDWLLSASHYESYGMAVADAVAHRLPVLATAVGEAPRLILPGVNGRLVQAGDWPDFHRQLRSLLSDPATWPNPVAGPPLRTWDQSFDAFVRGCETLMGELGHRSLRA